MNNLNHFFTLYGNIIIKHFLVFLSSPYLKSKKSFFLYSVIIYKFILKKRLSNKIVKYSFLFVLLSIFTFI